MRPLDKGWVATGGLMQVLTIDEIDLVCGGNQSVGGDSSQSACNVVAAVGGAILGVIAGVAATPLSTPLGGAIFGAGIGAGAAAAGQNFFANRARRAYQMKTGHNLSSD